MGYRYNVIKNFISDIGVIKELNNLFFKDKYIEDLSITGYRDGSLLDPKLIGAKGIIKNKMQIFQNGFYKMPNEKVCFGVLFPEGYKDISAKAMRAIYDFATEGKYNHEDNKYITNNLMNILFTSKDCIFAE